MCLETNLRHSNADVVEVLPVQWSGISPLRAVVTVMESSGELSLPIVDSEAIMYACKFSWSHMMQHAALEQSCSAIMLPVSMMLTHFMY